MSRYVLSPEAERDLEEIKTYLLQEAGLRVTRYVVREIRAALRFLSESPGAGHTREDLTEQPVKFWPVFSYLIVYDPRKQPIEVVRIFHGKRDAAQVLD